MNLFGRKKKAPAPKLTDAISKLRNVSATLDKREAHLQVQIKQALDAAKAKSRAKDKRGALFHLKRKKLFEKQVDQIYGKRHNIETEIIALESATVNKEVILAMKEGKRAMESNIKETDVEDVEETMDEIAEAFQLNDEYSEAISRPINGEMDDDELLDELEAMEAEMLDEELLETPTLPNIQQQQVNNSNIMDGMPAVPTHAHSAPTPPVQETAAEKEARELKELEASMGM